MYSYHTYNNYGHSLRHYFVSGLSKIMDFGNFNHIEYPMCMTDEEANNFDMNELRKDFEVVGKDLRKVFDSYEKEFPMR